MSDVVRYFTVTIPAGTPVTALHTADISFQPSIVTRIDWQVPPGPSGKMGWFLSMGRVQVAPKPVGSFVIADGQAGYFEGGSWPDSGAWQLTGYNTGTFPHTVYLTFHCDVPQAAVQRPGVLLTAEQLAPGPRLVIDQRTGRLRAVAG